MDIQQQINVNPNTAEALVSVKAVFYQYFEEYVDHCCMRIDLEFGLQLGKNREKIDKENYKKLLEYLRSVRKDIKQDYLFKVSAAFDDSPRQVVNSLNRKFDFSKASLVNDDVVEEDYAVAMIIRNCEHLFHEELNSFNKRLAVLQGKHAIADWRNPISPEKLVRALVEIVKPLKLNTDCRIALYKTFEVNVFSHLGFIYRELIKQCEAGTIARMQELEPRVEQLPRMTQLYELGEIKEEAEPVVASTEQIGEEFRRLQNKLELWRSIHSSSAYDRIPATQNTCYEHFEIKNALQVLQQFDGESSLPDERKQQSLKWRVIKKLEELDFSDEVRSLAKGDEDTLDLVSLIFSEIEQDELLSSVLKSSILQLEIPLSAAILGRYSFFINSDNSIRQLLDEVFAAGLFLSVDDHDDRLMQVRIASIVNRMTKNRGFEFSGWTAEAGEFSTYLNKQKQRSQMVEENARQLMCNKEVQVSNKKAVAMVIENSIQDKELPAAIAVFLRDVWQDVLLAAYERKEEEPERWEKSVQAMDELIISVMPLTDDDEKKRRLNLLPGLIAELRKGLKQISYDKSAQSHFFKDLAVWHITLMNKKVATGYINKSRAVPVNRAEIIAEVVADNITEQVSNLAEESWVAFISESGRQWGKLAWKGVDNCMNAGGRAMHGAARWCVESRNMLFVGKNGEKILEIQMDELAEKLRHGQAAIVKMNEKTITERALSKLMNL
ncbi:MAG: DUF1631 family protein [Methylobacter sp.]|nr:DUF1631 family protein [Methylobacter sp.]